ncbi:hypothetical protein EYF80_001809 [Liparis tanakae]|uniref:Uncharacterized protein n=1 Tax=Liparis tanakae TaxID=230148 RepID=A0A4Z2JC02_9TELE|nr:hypothetical protein EYF80_001809 [Liparis tanakae]
MSDSKSLETVSGGIDSVQLQVRQRVQSRERMAPQDEEGWTKYNLLFGLMIHCSDLEEANNPKVTPKISVHILGKASVDVWPGVTGGGGGGSGGGCDVTKHFPTPDGQRSEVRRQSSIAGQRHRHQLPGAQSLIVLAQPQLGPGGPDGQDASLRRVDHGAEAADTEHPQWCDLTFGQVFAEVHDGPHVAVNRGIRMGDGGLGLSQPLSDHTTDI